MKLLQHLEIGKRVYKEFNKLGLEPDRYKLRRIPFLIGNVAPDINCVYPAHRLTTTEKRFYKRLKTSTSTDINVVKSFTLGLITHYICDYFCYAHNNESIGLNHKKYETNLWNYYKAHVQELEDTPNRILKEWKRNKRESIYNNYEYNELTIDDQCKIILEQVKRMNEEYSKHTEISKKYNWDRLEDQLEYDLQYIIFMASHIDKLVLEPFRCIVVDA